MSGGYARSALVVLAWLVALWLEELLLALRMFNGAMRGGEEFGSTTRMLMRGSGCAGLDVVVF